MTDAEPLVIKGRRVDRKLLEPRPTQRCTTPECHSWCCMGGVWLDLGQKETILANAARIKPFLPPDRREEKQWFDGEREAHVDYPSGWGEGTTVVDDPTHPAGVTCIFLRPEDRYCALQMTSIACGEDPWSLKPFYCILHPLTIEGDLILLDDANFIYEEGGHCQREHRESVPLYVTFRAELTLVLGEDGYEELKRLASQE